MKTLAFDASDSHSALSMCANLLTTPTLASCADAIFASIQSSGQLSDEHLSSLNFLFEKHLSNTLQIIDQGGVFCFVGEKSGRRAYQVQGQRSSDRYTVFPEHFCSCQSFHFDVLSKAEAVYCKHQLATRLAICLGKERTTAVADTVLAEILQE